jgi:flagellar basal-body rod protein FlgB
MGSLVGDTYIFALASRQARWLSVRQATVANNVANANTPGFRTMDVQPFVDVLSRTQLRMAATDGAHLGPGGLEAASPGLRPAESWGVTHSGNSVGIEQEMIKAGEVNQTMSMNTAVVRSFHRMLMAAAKG